jgi:hypothetical protein
MMTRYLRQVRMVVSIAAGIIISAFIALSLLVFVGVLFIW